MFPLIFVVVLSYCCHFHHSHHYHRCYTQIDRSEIQRFFLLLIQRHVITVTLLQNDSLIVVSLYKSASSHLCFLFFCFSHCRFAPTRTPNPWDGIRIADKFSPVCPQRLPNIVNETAALEKMPKGRLEYLKRLLPFLQNQSEDCLYLNIFAPMHGKYESQVNF